MAAAAGRGARGHMRQVADAGADRGGQQVEDQDVGPAIGTSGTGRSRDVIRRESTAAGCAGERASDGMTEASHAAALRPVRRAGPGSRGPSGSTPAGSRSWSARRPGCRWRPRRRAPVDHHPVGGAGAVGMRQLRPGVRDRRGVDAAGVPGPARSPGGTSAYLRPPPVRWIRPGPRCRPTRRLESGVGVRWSPGTGWPGWVSGRGGPRDQPGAAVRGRSGPGRTGGRPVLDPRCRLPGPAGGAAGHRPRRAPAHAGLPGRDQPGPGRPPGRIPVRAVRRPGRHLPPPRPDTDSIVAAGLDLAG
jgi:hypothetical protein